MHRELGQNTVQPMNKGREELKNELARLRSCEFLLIQLLSE